MLLKVVLNGHIPNIIIILHTVDLLQMVH